MHTALKNLWASVAIDAGAVLDRDRSGAGDLTLETSGLRPTDRSRPSDLTLAGWGGAACDYMIDFACVSSTTPTWSNDPRWCIPGIAATEAEHAKLAADRASSAPVQGVHRYYPFVVEDRGRLGKSALTVVYIFAVLLAVRNFPGGPSAPTSCFLRGQSVQALRNFVAGQPAEFRRHLSRTRRGLLQRVSACVHGTLGGILSAGVQMAKFREAFEARAVRFDFSLHRILGCLAAALNLLEAPNTCARHAAPLAIFRAFREQSLCAPAGAARVPAAVPESSREFLGSVRVDLARCTLRWLTGRGGPDQACELLGCGSEGVVFRLPSPLSSRAAVGKVMDRFLLRQGRRHVPVLWELQAQRASFASVCPLRRICRGRGSTLLRECRERRVVLTNFRPTNLVLHPGGGKLVHVDLGLDVVRYNHPEWLAMARQLYCMLFWGGRPDLPALMAAARAHPDPGGPELAGLPGFMGALERELEPQGNGSQGPIGSPEVYLAEEANSSDPGGVVRESVESPFLEEPPALRALLRSLHARGVALLDAHEGPAWPVCSAMLGLTCHRLDLTLRHTSPAVASAGRDVALVIRSCAREHATIYQTARHLCEQLEGPHVFGRRALLCDSPPPSALCDADAEKQWRRQAERLRAEGVITQVFYASSAPAAVREHNVRWMGLDSEQTHSAGRSAPLSSMFQALQAVEGRHSYCVLLDSDMLVARLGRPRDRYLADMKGMLQRDAALLAVALPTREAVCRGPVPCGKLEVGWNRLLDEGARRRRQTFARCGSPTTFAMHPDYLLKRRTADHMLLLDGVEHGRMPSASAQRQLLSELEGVRKFSLPERCLPLFLPAARCEPVVVYAYGRSADSPAAARRFLHQLRQQEGVEWSCVLVVDGPGSGECGEYVDVACGQDARFTVVRLRTVLSKAAAMGLVATQLIQPRNAVVVPMDLREALIGSGVLHAIYRSYQGAAVADATVGRSLLACPHDYQDARLPSASPIQSFRRELLLRLFALQEDVTRGCYTIPLSRSFPHARRSFGPPARGAPPRLDEAIRQSSKQRLRVAVVGSANLLRVPAEHRAAVAAFAEELGRLLAESGFLVVTGGMGGVMEAACRGARRASGAGGLVTLGLLPWASSAGANNFVDVPLPTGLQEARNNLVALADAVVGVAGGGGTLSEMAYAWSSRRLLIAARGPGTAGKLADTSLDNRRDGVIHGVDLDRPQDAAAIIFRERHSLYGRQQAPGGIQAA
eukprot:jgi/Tetstr1/425084/TSEL_015548.t1